MLLIFFKLKKIITSTSFLNRWGNRYIIDEFLYRIA